MFNQKPVKVTGHGVVVKAGLVVLAVLSVSLWVNSMALAGGKGGFSGKSHAGKWQGSFSKTGVAKAASAKTGKLAKGGHHRHHRNHRWSQSRYNSQYGCNLFYDSADQCWYYWCPPDNCYYPLDYCPYGTYSWK